MITWLGSYRYEYALAAIPIQVILLVLYCLRRNLPTRSNASFLMAMFANLVMTVTDIAGCELIAVWDRMPLWLLYAVNMAYFVSFVLRGWALFDYAAMESRAYAWIGSHGRLIAAIPAIALIVLTLITPWAHTIFEITPQDGYRNLYLYVPIYYCTYFYLVLSAICVLFRREPLPRRVVASILMCNVILLVGILVRRQFSNVLVTSYFSILGILIIYLSVQNPDLYRHKHTGLFNRDAFERIVSELLFLNESFCCMTIAVQNYHSTKMLYGPQQTSEGLWLAGRWLLQTFDDCYVFYWGNGQFMLLNTHVGEMPWQEASAALDERFSHAWEAHGTAVSMRVASLGIPHALMPTSAAHVMELAHRAFEAAHDENANGRFATTTDLLTRIAREDAVESALEHGIAERRIEVYLQPIYSIREQAIVGAEALARLNDPQMGFIPPDEFIAAAEKNGSIMELGRQIFERVCAFVAQGEAQRLGIRRINVNLSPAQCLNDELAIELSAIAKRYAIPMDMFDFELTESSFGDHIAIQRQVLELKEHGAVFSLDDFGTGVSNLTRLMSLPIHVVKLDVGVVRSYFSGELSILPDLVHMFQRAHMETILEGVETQDMMDGVREMGCDYVQGYYFSKPLPPDEFIGYLRSVA